MVQLNLAGWSALIGAGIVAGVVVWLVTPLSVFLALPLGVIVVWATLGALDY